jgi:hypothetical protein
MHEVVALYSSWSSTLYSWACTAIVVLLWFWVVSGALFALRFLAFFLLEGNGRPTPLAAGSEVIQFPIDRFKHDTGREPFQD